MQRDSPLNIVAQNITRPFLIALAHLISFVGSQVLRNLKVHMRVTPAFSTMFLFWQFGIGAFYGRNCGMPNAKWLLYECRGLHRKRYIYTYIYNQEAASLGECIYVQYIFVVLKMYLRYIIYTKTNSTRER